MAASKSSAGRATASRNNRTTQARRASPEGLSGLAEMLTNRIIKPLGLVVLSRERIQETLDDAAERGRLTRSDANQLGAELIRLGRQQTDELLSDLERMLGQGRQRWDSATRRARSSETIDKLVRGADRARRTVGVGSAFPISGYDDLTAGQVQKRLGGLSPAELRKLRDYERRHANRKSVLSAIEKALS
jgi:polyhydroxyalkanoate synthesis regulator phasin